MPPRKKFEKTRNDSARFAENPYEGIGCDVSRSVITNQNKRRGAISPPRGDTDEWIT
jgi:hypothetical protein